MVWLRLRFKCGWVFPPFLSVFAVSVVACTQPAPVAPPPPPLPPSSALDRAGEWVAGPTVVTAAGGEELVTWELERCKPLDPQAFTEATLHVVALSGKVGPCAGVDLSLEPLLHLLGFEELDSPDALLTCGELRSRLFEESPPYSRLSIRDAAGEPLVATDDEWRMIYANLAAMGQDDFGLEAAGQRWFGRGVADLGLAETATLLGLARFPELVDNPSLARDLLLDQLEVASTLPPDDILLARGAPLPARKVPLAPISALPTYLWKVREELWSLEIPPLARRQGVRVTTPLDMNLLKEVRNSKRRILKLWEKNRKKEASDLAKVLEEYGNSLEAVPEELVPPGSIFEVPEDTPFISFVGVEPRTGRVRVLEDDALASEIRAKSALFRRRQPGSSFKTFLYATAIEAGMTQVDRLTDKRYAYQVKEEVWTPRNHEDHYLGEMIARRALAHSENSVAIQLIFRLGPTRVAEMARRLGISTPIHAVPALALGTSPVTLMDMTCAIGAFASGGVKVVPRFIDTLTDLAGREIPLTRAAAEQVLDPRVAYVMLDMLREVTLSGTAAAARKLPFPVAGKTGTTNESKDAWFIGTAADLVGGVWVGFDNKDPLGGHETGGSLALPVWLDTMTALAKEKVPGAFEVPPGVVIEPRSMWSGRPDSKGRNMAFIAPSRKSCYYESPEGALPMEGDEVLPKPPRTKKKVDPACRWVPASEIPITVVEPPTPAPTPAPAPAPSVAPPPPSPPVSTKAGQP